MTAYWTPFSVVIFDDALSFFVSMPMFFVWFSLANRLSLITIDHPLTGLYFVWLAFLLITHVLLIPMCFVWFWLAYRYPSLPFVIIATCRRRAKQTGRAKLGARRSWRIPSIRRPSSTAARSHRCGAMTYADQWQVLACWYISVSGCQLLINSVDSS